MKCFSGDRTQFVIYGALYIQHMGGIGMCNSIANSSRANSVSVWPSLDLNRLRELFLSSLLLYSFYSPHIQSFVPTLTPGQQQTGQDGIRTDLPWNIFSKLNIMHKSICYENKRKPMQGSRIFKNTISLHMLCLLCIVKNQNQTNKNNQTQLKEISSWKL